MERNKTLNSLGFTLTEILVVIFIISLLSGITFANYRQGGKQMALQRSAYKLAQDIRRAQEMAIGSVECPTSTCVGQIPPSYGIYLPKNADYYVLYADVSGSNNRYDDPAIETIEVIPLEKGIQITSNQPSTSWLCINFKPPDPMVILTIVSGGITTTTVATTTLTLTGTTLSKEIIVNTAGLVEIK